MDTFKKWFQKKPDPTPETAASSPEEGESAADSTPPPAAAGGEALDVSGTTLERDAPPGAAENSGGVAPPVAAVDSGTDAPAPEPAAEPRKKGFFQEAWETTKRIALTPVDPWFEKMAEGLDRTRKSLVGQVVTLFRLHQKIDEAFWEELEDILITADVGSEATDRVIDTLRQAVKQKGLSEPAQLLAELKAALGEILGRDQGSRELRLQEGRVNVVMMVGVNGSGKTTSTAKLAHRFRQEGKKVMVAAADTFRAAAIDQLEVWTTRVDVPLVRHKEGADPAAVVFDAVQAAQARGTGVLLIDTAGRLHSKINLMKELEKISRVASRELEGAPHEVLLVLDATNGQNALQQARVFGKSVGVTGLVLCKLDGTAKGGIILAIAQELQIPVKFIGVGEGVEDIEPFDPRTFVDALFQA